MSDPLVSIALVTRDGGAVLAATLDAIAAQHVDFPVELVAVDSGSRDQTVALLERSACRVIRVPPDSFDHGETRNVAIRSTRGTFVVLLVQDAVPTSDDWLARLVAPLQADPLVAGAFCRQQPRPDATTLTRCYLDRWVATSPTPRTVSLAGPSELERLDPMARLRLCAFDNVCSCIRRSVWERIPFTATPIAEDLEWARQVLLAGYCLQYVPDAVVLHSHERSARYEFSRTCALHSRLGQLFGLRTVPTAPLLAQAILSSMRLHLECEREAVRSGGRRSGLWRAFALAVAWPLGQYVGGLSAAKGWQPPHFHRI